MNNVAVPAFLLGQLLVAQDAVNPLSGGSGWAGAGLLGCVLAWLLFIRLPAGDKQLKELLDSSQKATDRLIDLNTSERDKESKARHEMLNGFQVMMSKLDLDHREDVKRSEDQHRVDAINDRESFNKRQDLLIAEIRQQTSELRAAIVAGSCKYRPGEATCPMLDPRPPVTPGRTGRQDKNQPSQPT